MRRSAWCGIGADLPWLGGMALAGAAIVMVAPAQAATLDSWQFDPNTQQLVITVPEGVTPRYYLVAEPARIVIDVPNTSVGAVPLQQSYSGVVRQVRIAEFQPGLTRIVLELSPEAVLAPGQVELERLEDSNTKTQRWALRPLLVTDTPSPTVAQSTEAPAAAPSNATSSDTASNPAPPNSEAVATAPTAAPPGEMTAAPAAETPSTETPDVDPQSTAPAAAQPSTAANPLPPLEPNAVEIPIEMATPTPSTAAPARAEDRPTGAPESPAEAPSIETPTEPVAEVAPPAAEANSTAAVPDESANSVSQQPVNPPASVPVNPPAPVAAVSEPVPIDFSTPPPSVTTPSGTAAALSLPSIGQSAIAAPTPATSSSAAPGSSSLSFPTPTSGAVNVPSINTIAANQAPAQAPAQSPEAARGIPTPTATPSAATNSPSPASPQPTTVRFGQPLAAGQPVDQPRQQSAAVPAPAPVHNAIPFGQPLAPAPSSKPEIEVIPFGQPLPTPQSGISTPPGSSGTLQAGVSVPTGTILKLRYPGQTVLELANRPSHQEVLLLENPVHDQAGNVIIPAGSPVLGRFETSNDSSQFIAQTVQLQGRNVALMAKSDQLPGGRQVRQPGLLRNSALGAVAGTLLGAVTGIGLIPAVLAGAATSAATTYVTSPQGPAVIQPNQVVEVRLIEDLTQ